jgi:hypothetical protein
MAAPQAKPKSAVETSCWSPIRTPSIRSWMLRKSRSRGGAGKIITAAGCGSHGEPVRRTRNKSGSMRKVWQAASRLRPERQVAADMLRRYAGSKRDKTGRT